jgi:hypothetical protein
MKVERETWGGGQQYMVIKFSTCYFDIRKWLSLADGPVWNTAMTFFLLSQAWSMSKNCDSEKNW